MSINVVMIRESFETAKPIADQIMNGFYENLFADFPESQALFSKSDMTKQKAALLHALVTAVDNLDNPDTLIKFLIGLGERHYKYGTEDLHYDWVGQTLLKTFGQFFGSSWTDELRSQWAEVYGVLAQVMKKGAHAAASNNVTPIGTKERASHKSSNSPSSQIEAEISPLSNDMKETIRLAVKAHVRKQIRAEVQKWLAEEMQEIAKMSPEELLRRVV